METKLKDKKVISVIPANKKVEPTKSTEMIRVGAYCRVSTDLEEQSSSYEAQVDYFKNFVNNKPNQKLVDIYADEGISGTSTKKRKEFNRMIDDCMKGKIDLVVTKSISRFARNTIDSISYVRQLKEKGIGVFFEKENINSLDPNSEFILTILSSLAQEESRSLSTNCKWGIKRKFENGQGTFVTSHTYGYIRHLDGTITIDEEQAEVVRLIFKLYLEGYSNCEIKRYLESNNIKTSKGLNVWMDTTIRRMLLNERYTGNSLLQKTVSVDYLTKKRKKNEGEENQYYVENTHPAIIPQETYNLVQAEIKRRNSISKKSTSKSKSSKDAGKYSSKYAFSEILYCSECGRNYKRQIWKHYTPVRNVWRCLNRLEYGKKICTHSPTMDEITIQNAVVEAINKVYEESGETDFIQNTVAKNIESILTQNVNPNTIIELNKKIEKTKKEIMQSIENDIETDVIDDNKYIQLKQSLRELENEKKKLEANILNSNSDDARVKCAKDTIKNIESKITEYDDILTRRLVERIEIKDKNHILVIFKGNMAQLIEID